MRKYRCVGIKRAFSVILQVLGYSWTTAFLLAIVFASIALVTQAQPRFDHPRGRTLSNHLSKKIKVDRVVIENACVASVAFAKFEITSEGKMENLVFSKMFDGGFRDAVEIAIRKSEKYWQWENRPDKPARKTFVLPIIYTLEYACADWLKPEADKELRSAYWSHFSGYGEFLYHMLRFEDGNFRQLNCTLLAPFVYSRTREIPEEYFEDKRLPTEDEKLIDEELINKQD